VVLELLIDLVLILLILMNTKNMHMRENICERGEEADDADVVHLLLVV
jgi:hypothetical protein